MTEVDPSRVVDRSVYIVRARYEGGQPWLPDAVRHPDPGGRGLVPLLRRSRVVSSSRRFGRVRCRLRFGLGGSVRRRFDTSCSRVSSGRRVRGHRSGSSSSHVEGTSVPCW